MTEAGRLRFPMLPATCLAALALAACLFDKAREEVELTLTGVPASVEEVQVVAVERRDTAKVLATLVSRTAWSEGRVLRFPLGKAQGEDWLLRAEGYQDDHLVYLSLIPPGNDPDSIRRVDVTPGLPAVIFTGVTRDSLNATFTTAFRKVSGEVHWQLNPKGRDSVRSSNPTLTVKLADVPPGTVLTADLRDENHQALAVQLPDSILADEVLSPAGSKVRITGASTSDDTVFLELAYENFQEPSVDEPIPGRGLPRAYDQNGRRISGLKTNAGNIARLWGPASALSGVTKVIVALHYADNMRIRPLVADTVEAAAVLQAPAAAPALDILSQARKGDNLEVILERRNFRGLHTHFYRDKVEWPRPTVAYQLCHTDTCAVLPAVWQGARMVYVAAHKDETHDQIRPLVVDSLVPP